MISWERDISLAGYTVIFPSVCVGNVAQLAVDLMISTLELKKVASLWHPSIIPIVGPRAFEHRTSDIDDTNNVTTACELFVSEQQKIACFQLRSPLQPALLDSFFSFFFDDILQKQQVAELIILTSSFAHEQHAIDTVKFLHVTSNGFKDRHKDSLADVQLLSEWPKQLGEVIHGGGFALRFWQAIEQHQLPVCIFFKYVSEGDNRSDAFQMLDRLDQLLNGQILAGKDWVASVKVPVSWKAVFGNYPTEQLY